MYKYLSEDEKYAILYAMNCVIGADGEVQPEEHSFRGKMIIYLDLYHDKSDDAIVKRKMESMDIHRALSILSNMADFKKKFAVAAMIGTMKADSVKHPIEIHTIDVITSYANLPYVSESEAQEMLNQYGLIGSKWNLLLRTFF